MTVGGGGGAGGGGATTHPARSRSGTSSNRERRSAGMGTIGSSASGQARDAGQVAITLVAIEPVADHEHVRDLAPHVVELHFRRLRPSLGEEGAHLERRWTARLEIAEEIGEGEPACADSLDHQHVLPLDGLVEVLFDAD